MYWETVVYHTRKIQHDNSAGYLQKYFKHLDVNNNFDSFLERVHTHQDTTWIPKNLNNALLLLNHSPVYSSNYVLTGKNCVSETHESRNYLSM
jgi:hypothetical protein